MNKNKNIPNAPYNSLSRFGLLQIDSKLSNHCIPHNTAEMTILCIAMIAIVPRKLNICFILPNINRHFYYCHRYQNLLIAEDVYVEKSISYSVWSHIGNFYHLPTA